MTGSVNEDLAIQAVTYVSAFAAVLAVKAVQNRMLRKGRMKELDRLNREKDIKDFDECPRLPRKMKAEESVKVTNPDYPDLGTTMNCTFCTTAMALREKGYDVQATKVSDGFFSDDFFKATFNSPEVKMGRKKSGQAVLDTLSQTGDRVLWQSDRGLETRGGSIVFSGRMRAAELESMTVRAEKRLLNLRRKPDRSWTLSI